MAKHSSMLHVRMDSDLKRRATEALAAMGLTALEAVPAVPPHRGRSGVSAGAEGSQRRDPRGHGWGR